MKKQPRVLIEDWLPAAAIGVECFRERSTGQQPPDKRLHIWWARRPLVVSRAAVLGSLLPADFPYGQFEKLLGFGQKGSQLVKIRRLMDTGVRVEGGFNCKRAFTNAIPYDFYSLAHREMERLWGNEISIVDPMAGGGSIPLEAARLGITAWANEYNPVACSVLEATVNYPFRFGEELEGKARKWGKVWEQRASKRLSRFYPKKGFFLVHAYIFSRTVPCPDTQFPTPLVPDWHLLKPKSGRRVVAEPLVDREKGTWTVRIREIGKMAGQLQQPPLPTYSKGKGVSLFTGRQIPADYIKAMAQQGKMESELYAVAMKTGQGLEFRSSEPADFKAIEEAERELMRLQPGWMRANITPTEFYPEVSSDERPRLYGMPRWADMFSPRQLLAFGVLVEELRDLKPEILQTEGLEVGEAVESLLALTIDKFLNYNNMLCSWHAPRSVIRGIFDRHDFSFKETFAEMAPCNAGTGLDWAIDNVLDAYKKLATLPRAEKAQPVKITMASATNLPELADGSVTAVVVDPPYADNVQYSELADFFYVWLKRTQGHRRPEWFSTYLCDYTEEAVVNTPRYRNRQANPDNGGRRTRTTAEARTKAHTFYQRMMADIFRECRRILRDDGVLTVMFTHKKQEAWESLFESLIQAGFIIRATWPVKTESEHSLHQAKKNAAQSTVLLVARKRPDEAGVGYFDRAMRNKIRQRVEVTAERLRAEGLNPVDQLVGSFGPAMEVYSRYREVRTDTGEPVGVGKAIAVASETVSQWRIRQLAERGLEGVEAEGQFVLLCWDVLGAAEFRFNEAKLLGNAVRMEADRLIQAGLVKKSGDKIRMLPVSARRRQRPLEQKEMEELELDLGLPVRSLKKRGSVRRIHPNDPYYLTTLDACQALAMRYIDARGEAGGVGSAKALARQQRWTKGSSVGRLMEALVKAAPEALWRERGEKSVAAEFPEFRAWHALLKPLFDIEPPDWREKKPPQVELFSVTSELEKEEIGLEIEKEGE